MDDMRKRISFVFSGNEKPWLSLALLFAYTLILSILWGYMVLGRNGFSSNPGLFLAAGSPLILLLFPLFLLFQVLDDGETAADSIAVAFWNITGYFFCTYFAKRTLGFSAWYEAFGFPLYMAGAMGVWLVLQRSERKVSGRLYSFILWIVGSTAVLTSFMSGIPMGKALSIFTVLTLLLYQALLGRRRGHRVYSALASLIILGIWTAYTGSVLGSYGKGVIHYGGKEYNVIYNDRYYQYCLDSDGERVLIRSEEVFD